MGYDDVRYERRGPIGLVTIDRPERSNAVDYDTGQEIVDAMERIDGDDEF